MIDRLAIVKQRFDEVSDLIIQPDIIADQKRYIALNREYKDLNSLMEKRKQYLDLTQRQKEAEEILYHSLSNGLSYKVGGGCILTLCPPMTITEEELNEAFNIIEAGIKKVC